MDAITVTVTSDELEHLHERLLRFTSAVDPDLNRVLVHAATTGVTWTATDSYRLARLPAGTADTTVRGTGGGAGVDVDGRLAVPARTLLMAWQMCDRRDAGGATFSVCDGGRGTLRLPGIDVPFDASLAGYPDLDGYLDDGDDEDHDEAAGAGDGGAGGATRVTVSAEDLFAAIHGASLPPPWLDHEAQQNFVLHVDAARGVLRAVATWEGHPDTAAAVACTASGSVRVGVNPRFLYELAEAARQDVLTVRLSEDPSVPLRVDTADGFRALLMPVRIGVESARPAFEAMLAELLGVDADDLERDGDGDYPVPLGDEHSMYVTLRAGDVDAGVPDTAHVFAVLATGIEPSRELLAELNDLNRHVRFARLFWADGAVLAGDELLLSTLDADELGHACRTVAALAARVAPMLTMVHGAAPA